MSALKTLTRISRSIRASGHREIDALGERQLAAVIDRVGRAPHIGAPGVGAAFPASARLSLAAERPAYLRAGWADVHIDDPAVGARRRKEQLRLAKVGREDRRGQTLRRRVVEGDRFLQAL